MISLFFDSMSFFTGSLSLISVCEASAAAASECAPFVGVSVEEKYLGAILLGSECRRDGES